jgi:hypothetical protein
LFFIKNIIFNKYNQVYFSFYALHNISALNSLLYLYFLIHLRDGMLVTLLLSLSCLAFEVVATISLLSKETTFGGLSCLLDTLAAATTIFV